MSCSSPIGSVPAVSFRSCAWWQVGFVIQWPIVRYEQRSLETHGTRDLVVYTVCTSKIWCEHQEHSFPDAFVLDVFGVRCQSSSHVKGLTFLIYTIVYAKFCTNTSFMEEHRNSSYSVCYVLLECRFLPHFGRNASLSVAMFSGENSSRQWDVDSIEPLHDGQPVGVAFGGRLLFWWQPNSPDGGSVDLYRLLCVVRYTCRVILAVFLGIWGELWLRFNLLKYLYQLIRDLYFGTSLCCTSLIVELQLSTWKTLGESPNFIDRVDGAEIPLINS